MALSRLGRDIDAGHTGDKSPAMDPAAAPLGTDDEAGESAARWCIFGVALVLAAFLKLWLLR